MLFSHSIPIYVFQLRYETGIMPPHLPRVGLDWLRETPYMHREPDIFGSLLCNVPVFTNSLIMHSCIIIMHGLESRIIEKRKKKPDEPPIVDNLLS